jgi:cell division protein FtsA
MADYLAAIDLGTTKIVSIVGEKIKNSGRIKILAYSEAPSIGIRRGQVENIQSVVGVVRNTLDNIRVISGISDIDEVYVGIAGLNIRTIESRTEILRPQYEELITDKEIRMLEANACKLHVNVGEKIIHVIPQTYSIDDVHEITDPVGRLGYKLAGNFMIIIEKGVSTKHIEICFDRLNLSLKEMILEPMASAKAVLYEDEKEMGVIMIDMGGGTTDIIIFHNGIIRHTAIIPFGGNIITQDIRTGCDIPLRDAENIKIQHGSCVSSMVSEHHIISVPRGEGREPCEISFKSLARIIEARMIEIMDMILSEIKKYTDNNRKFGAGIVFTGGGSQMTHLHEFVKLKTGMDIRIGRPIYVSESSPKEIVHPKYSTAVGLIMCGFDSLGKYEVTEKLEVPKVTEIPEVSEVIIENINSNNSSNTGNSTVEVSRDDSGNANEDIRTTLKSVISMFKNVLYNKEEKV